LARRKADESGTRWRIEAAFNRLKDFRRITARYDRLARNYLASVCLIATLVWWIYLMSPEPIASHSVVGAVIRVRIELVRKAEAIEEGAVAELVGIEVGVVSRVFNLESSGVEASDWRPRHDEQYHEA
jgi:hypothetical protein